MQKDLVWRYNQNLKGQGISILEIGVLILLFIIKVYSIFVPYLFWVKVLNDLILFVEKVATVYWIWIYVSLIYACQTHITVFLIQSLQEKMRRIKSFKLNAQSTVNIWIVISFEHTILVEILSNRRKLRYFQVSNFKNASVFPSIVVKFKISNERDIFLLSKFFDSQGKSNLLAQFLCEILLNIVWIYVVDVIFHEI